MQVLKKVFIVILSIPVIIIGLFIIFEIFGMIVNHAAAGIQTRKLANTVKEIDGLEIMDTYSETGNTSGTGNHVDMRTILIVRTDKGILSLQECLKEYADMDEWSFQIEKLSDVKKAHEEYGYLSRVYDILKIPDKDEECFLIYYMDSAPFADNIEGH